MPSAAELQQTAAILKSILDANPLDVGALEGLRDIYTQLGARAELSAVMARLEVVAGETRLAAEARNLGEGRLRNGRASALATAPSPNEGAPTRKGRTAALGDLLINDGLVTREQLQAALAQQKKTREKLGVILVRLNLITEDQLVGFLSRQYGIPS